MSTSSKDRQVMLTKQQVIKILGEGLEAFQKVLEGKIYYQGVPVQGKLGNWGGRTPLGCSVCIAGARYLARNKVTIFDDVAQLQKDTKVPRNVAMHQVLGDAEILLDAMRLPLLSHSSSSFLSGGMKVPGLFRELGIEVPPCSIKTEYLDEAQVIDRIQAILLLNGEKEESAVQPLMKY
jgi:hypothetical protein